MSTDQPERSDEPSQPGKRGVRAQRRPDGDSDRTAPAAYGVTMSLVEGPYSALLLLVLMLVPAVAFAGVYLLRGKLRQLQAVAETMTRLARGETGIEIPRLDREGAFGAMANALQTFRDRSAGPAGPREQPCRAAARERPAQGPEAMEALAAAVEASIKGVVDALAAAAAELQSTAEGMSATAERSSRQTSAVAAATEQAMHNVQTVASAAEQLSASILEIGRQVSHSTQITGQAAEQVHKTNREVENLASAAQRIGEVVEVISRIAEQTNLLALNATIEATRAGAAGKGFAVVAGEVKSLAGQTAIATREVAEQVEGIQSASADAVAAMTAITTTIGQVDQIATAIAAAVEQQGAATQEISRSVQQAASGTEEVSINLGDVDRAAGETGAMAGRMLEAANRLTAQSGLLGQEVERLLARVRGA